MSVRLLLAGIVLVLAPAVGHALEVTGNDDGKSFTVRPAERVGVILRGNPATGYLWEVSGVDRQVLAPDGEPTYAPDARLAGSPGNFTFRFNAVTPGTSALEFVYRRPWEKGVAPLQRFRVAVTVAPAETAASYRAADGTVLQALFDLARATVRVTLPEGRNVTLPLAVSASGARYSDGTETFWEHQGTGRFLNGERILFEGKVVSGPGNN